QKTKAFMDNFSMDAARQLCPSDSTAPPPLDEVKISKVELANTASTETSLPVFLENASIVSQKPTLEGSLLPELTSVSNDKSDANSAVETICVSGCSCSNSEKITMGEYSQQKIIVSKRTAIKDQLEKINIRSQSPKRGGSSQSPLNTAQLSNAIRLE